MTHLQKQKTEIMVTVKLKSGYCSGPVIDFYLIKASLKQATLHLQRELEANTFLFSLTHIHRGLLLPQKLKASLLRPLAPDLNNASETSEATVQL